MKLKLKLTLRNEKTPYNIIYIQYSHTNINQRLDGICQGGDPANGERAHAPLRRDPQNADAVSLVFHKPLKPLQITAITTATRSNNKLE